VNLRKARLVFRAAREEKDKTRKQTLLDQGEQYVRAGGYTSHLEIEMLQGILLGMENEEEIPGFVRNTLRSMS